MKTQHFKHPDHLSLSVARLAGIAVMFLLISMLGCSPFARLEGVIVDEQLAQDADLSNVRVVRENTQLATTINMDVNKGDFVYTDSETQAVIVAPAWEVIVFPDSDVEILNPSIFVKIGKVLVKTVKKVKDKFKVKKEYVTAGAEGTEFLVEVSGDGMTEITVVEGRVLLEFPAHDKEPVYVTNRTKATVVNEGETVSSSISDVSTGRINEIRRWITQAENVIRPRVPELMNLPIEEARQRLRSVGLEIREREKITGEVAVGIVNGQSPRAGTRVEIGERVKVDVEAESVTVPPLIGLSLQEARAVIAEAGLTVISARSELRTEGEAQTVFEQSIDPGKLVRPGKGMVLKIVEPAVLVPNLVGLDRQSALASLKNAGLAEGTVSEMVSSRYPEGAVAKQSPSAGTLYKKGSSVNLTLAKAEPLCNLPDVTKMTEREAQSILKEAGFSWKTVVAGEGNSVTRQSPAPGMVKCGITVTLTVLRIQ